MDSSPAVGYTKSFKIRDALLLKVSPGQPATMNFRPFKAEPPFDHGDFVVLAFPGFSLDREAKEDEM